MKRRFLPAFLGGLSLVASSCASYSIDDQHGNKLSGSSMNGSYSVSHGPACQPATPSPATPIPANYPTFASQAQVCDTTGHSCRLVNTSTTVIDTGCDTTVVNIRGTDPTTWLQWIIGAGLGVFALAK